jgi:hypothetical protein
MISGREFVVCTRRCISENEFQVGVHSLKVNSNNLCLVLSCPLCKIRY